MEDCITISDDEIEFIGHVITVEPFLIDLTKDRPKRQQKDRPARTQSQKTIPEPENAQQEPEKHKSDSKNARPDTPRVRPEPPKSNSHPAWFRSESTIFRPGPTTYRPEPTRFRTVPTTSEAQSTTFRPEPPTFRPDPAIFKTQSQKTTDDEAQAGHQEPRPETEAENNMPEPKKVRPEPSETIPEHKKVNPEPKEVTSEPIRVSSQPNEAMPDPGEAMPEPNTVTPEPDSNPAASDSELVIKLKTLGNEKYRHNLFDEAIKIYRRASELAKALDDKEMSAILHFNLAMTYYRLGSFDQATDECANAVKLDDCYYKAHLKRAEIYMRQGKFEEAVICYEHVCELDNKNQDYAILLCHAKDKAKKAKKKDYHQILGLKYNFTQEDLKKAYRQNALTHHPDRHSDADIVSRRIHEKRFKDASEAHSFLQVRLGGSRF